MASKWQVGQRIPVLMDGDFVVTESRAILAYLVNSRKPGDALYPTDPKKRALIDSRLYYDGTVFFPNLLAVIVKKMIFWTLNLNAFTQCFYFS
jgi:glutathione S-transferase